MDAVETEPPSEPTLSIEISDLQGWLEVDRSALRARLEFLLRKLGVGTSELSIAVVDDEAIWAINRDHLGHDWPTDVVTFPLGEPGLGALAGEVVVSAQTAVASANERCLEPAAELDLYIVHGILHLLGFDDTTEDEAVRMREMEQEALAFLALADSPAEHGGAIGSAALGGRSSCKV